MKIIAISDTHINYGHIEDNLPKDLLQILKKADLIIHAGDFVIKKAFDELSKINRLEAVHGNMDEWELKKLLPERKIIDIENVRLGIVHEAALSIQDATGAFYMAKEMGADVLVFGHIHKPVIEKSEMLLICPGSPTEPRLSEASAVELDIEGDEISGRIITLEGTKCGAFESAGSFFQKSIKP
jgi:putative phosphoesterase